MRPNIKKQPTLQDIGDKLGLTKRAVSQALNERGGTVKVSEATRSRVQEMAKAMGYRQNMAAKALTTGRTGMYGILSFQSFMHISSIRLMEATEEFRRQNIVPLVLNCSARTEEITMQSVQTLTDAGVDGVLLLAPSINFNSKHAEKFQDHGIPVVTIGHCHDAEIPTYTANRFEAFTQMTSHVIATGNRSITVLIRKVIPGKPDALNPEAPLGTLQGVKAAIRKHPKLRGKIDLNVHYITAEMLAIGPDRLPEIHPLYVPGYLAMRDMIKSGSLPEALICQVDGWALGAMRACNEAGVSVPKDIVITGYGDDPAGSASYVPLTTLAEPIPELSKLAVTELLALCRENKPPTGGIALPCELIIRQSSVRTRLPIPELSPTE